MELNNIEIRNIYNTKNIELFDFEIKILSNRLNNIQKIFNILSKNINSKYININKFKNEIFTNTNFNLSNEEIFEISKNLLKNNSININILDYIKNKSKKINKIILNKIFNQEISNILYNITL